MVYIIYSFEPSTKTTYFNRKCLGFFFWFFFERWKHETHMQSNNHRSTSILLHKNRNLFNQPLKMMCTRIVSCMNVQIFAIVMRRAGFAFTLLRYWNSVGIYCGHKKTKNLLPTQYVLFYAIYKYKFYILFTRNAILRWFITLYIVCP